MSKKASLLVKPVKGIGHRAAANAELLTDVFVQLAIVVQTRDLGSDVRVALNGNRWFLAVRG